MDTNQILSFLKDLRNNNSKEWMDQHRETYEEARETFKKLVAALLNEIAAFDPDISGLTPKDCIFRINRDIRFSKDKNPYKNNFGAAISEGGKKGPNAVYYLHLQPNDLSFVAGGLYMPSAENLQKVRQEIDYNPESLKNIVTEKKFRDLFGAIQGEKLKRPPKGYDASHPNIELLKHKSFIVTHALPDEKVASEGFIQEVVPLFRQLEPLNRYMNVAIS